MDYDWIELFDNTTQHAYYYNKKTSVTQWVSPNEEFQPCLLAVKDFGGKLQYYTISQWLSKQSRENHVGSNSSLIKNDDNTQSKSLTRKLSVQFKMEAVNFAEEDSNEDHKDKANGANASENAWCDHSSREDLREIPPSHKGLRFRTLSRIDSALLHDLLQSSSQEEEDEDTDGSASPPSPIRKNRVRANTSTTSYFGSTLSNPDATEEIQCVSGAIHTHMKQFEMGESVVVHSRYHIFQDDDIASTKIPSREEIFFFVSSIYSKGQMEPECIIMSFAYLERLLKATNGFFTLKSNNWRGVTLSTLILASKVWDDMSMWNVDFSKICPSFTLKRINKLEICLLEAIKYEVRISSSQYAKYYFRLRSMREAFGIPVAEDSRNRRPSSEKFCVDKSNDENVPVSRRRCNTVLDELHNVK